MNFVMLNFLPRKTLLGHHHPLQMTIFSAFLWFLSKKKSFREYNANAGRWQALTFRTLVRSTERLLRMFAEILPVRLRFSFGMEKPTFMGGALLLLLLLL